MFKFIASLKFSLIAANISFGPSSLSTITMTSCAKGLCKNRFKMLLVANEEKFQIAGSALDLEQLARLISVTEEGNSAFEN